jgi:site-specific DNA-methyltransferase (adenine-specific)
MIDAGFYNMDCMDGMAQFPDKFFSLAIVDPPYGIGDKFKGGKSGKMNFNEIVEKRWDDVPDEAYFSELFRVSKNQIIWGGNYFNLPPSRCFIVWDKLIAENFSLAMAELAWTSFDKLTKIKRLPTPKDGLKIHPTQKPIALYKWLLSNYAKPGDKILDTHVGSASSLIACHQMGYEYWGFELDTDYFNAATERLNRAKAQVSMTELVKPIQARQIAIWGE